MTSFMFQEKYGIQLCVEKQEKDCQGAKKGAINVVFFWYRVSSRQEGHLHMEFTISSISRQWVSIFNERRYKHWAEQGDI